MISASYGKRVAAVFLDWLFVFVPSVVFIVAGVALLLSDSSASTGFGIFLLFIGGTSWIALILWNKVFREGKTGQSFGKARMNISLVDSNSALPIGAGRCFLREFLFSLLSSASGGLFWFIDYLWPLADKNNERLMDKIMTSRVIETSGTSGPVVVADVISESSMYS